MAVIHIARVYDPGIIQPVAEWGHNIGVFLQDDWLFFRVDHVEGLPASRQLTQDLGSVNNNANSGETEITVARAQDGNLLHVRCLPLDNVEIDVFHGRSTGGRHTTYSAKARIYPQLINVDPFAASSTLFVFGNQRPIYAVAYNESGYNLAQSRVKFWGYRYRLDPLPGSVTHALRKSISGIAMEKSEEEMLHPRGPYGKVTLIPAQGRE
tara:strand:- start:137 stop:766 length:630 start_codon:yes stop_codon:yes gene_type:complete